MRSSPLTADFLLLLTAAIWGFAYALQVAAQRRTRPAHASILMSLEAVCAAVGGWWILDEALNLRALAGCGFMLGGMLLSPLWALRG